MSGIVDRDAPVLRKVAAPVKQNEIQNSKTRSLIADMKRLLAREKDGVALAAPQVGASVRLFVVSGKVYAQKERAKRGAISPEGGTDKKVNRIVFPDQVFINPVITKRSRERGWMDEGCLSVRWLYGKAPRAKKVTVEALNERGEKMIVGASGLLAQIFQHEIDHLDGILFTDSARDIHELPPEEE